MQRFRSCTMIDFFEFLYDDDNDDDDVYSKKITMNGVTKFNPTQKYTHRIKLILSILEARVSNTPPGCDITIKDLAHHDCVLAAFPIHEVFVLLCISYFPSHEYFFLFDYILYCTSCTDAFLAGSVLVWR
jgi:hypothetical protein